MIVPLKTPTNAPTTTSKAKQGLQPMNTDNKTQQQTLSNAQLANRINDLINLTIMTRNSLPTEPEAPEAHYGLKETDAKLAALMDYYGEEIRKEEARKSPPTLDHLKLLDMGTDAYTKADALLTAIIMNQDGEGFYTLRHDLSHAYIASINAEVERMKTTIDGLEKLVREVS